MYKLAQESPLHAPRFCKITRRLVWNKLGTLTNQAVRTGHLSVATGRYSEAHIIGTPLHEFEWSSKPFCNTYAALHRHLSANAPATELDQFKVFCAKYWIDVFERIQLPEPVSFKTYPPRAFEHDHTKRDKYLRGI